MVDFHLQFGEPKHGWLPVRIELGDERYEFTASNVLNDPVYDLAVRGLHILRYSEAAVVSWWLEPEWNTLVFEPTFDGESLLVSFYEHHTEGCTESARRSLQAAAATHRACRDVGRALRKLLHEFGRGCCESSAGWNRPFPEEIIREIYTELQVRNQHGGRF